MQRSRAREGGKEHLRGSCTVALTEGGEDWVLFLLHTLTSKERAKRGGHWGGEKSVPLHHLDKEGGKAKEGWSAKEERRELEDVQWEADISVRMTQRDWWMKDGSKASGEETSQKYLKEDSGIWREFRNKTRVEDKRRKERRSRRWNI